MNTSSSNDNGGSPPDERRLHPDGEAAILLVESLLHGLIARGVLSVADAVEIVNTAAEVNVELAEDRSDAPAASDASISRLQSISASLRYDLPPE